MPRKLGVQNKRGRDYLLEFRCYRCGETVYRKIYTERPICDACATLQKQEYGAMGRKSLAIHHGETACDRCDFYTQCQQALSQSFHLAWHDEVIIEPTLPCVEN